MWILDESPGGLTVVSESVSSEQTSIVVLVCYAYPGPGMSKCGQDCDLFYSSYFKASLKTKGPWE